MNTEKYFLGFNRFTTWLVPYSLAIMCLAIARQHPMAGVIGFVVLIAVTLFLIRKLVLYKQKQVTYKTLLNIAATIISSTMTLYLTWSLATKHVSVDNLYQFLPGVILGSILFYAWIIGADKIVMHHLHLEKRYQLGYIAYANSNPDNSGRLSLIRSLFLGALSPVFWFRWVAPMEYKLEAYLTANIGASERDHGSVGVASGWFLSDFTAKRALRKHCMSSGFTYAILRGGVTIYRIAVR